MKTDFNNTMCSWTQLLQSELMLHHSFSKNMVDYDFGTSTRYSLVLVQYIYILVPGNCGGLKGMADKAVTPINKNSLYISHLRTYVIL